MKKLLRSVVFHVFALWLTSAMIPALSISGNLWGMLSAGFTLAIMMILLKPLISLILLPVNIITLGLSRLKNLSFSAPALSPQLAIDSMR